MSRLTSVGLQEHATMAVESEEATTQATYHCGSFA